jgi:hypothetical protein
MKNFFLLSCVILAAFVGKAQSPYGTAGTFALAAGDTLNNVDTVFKVLPVTAGYGTVGITVNLTKISGTVAGKAILYGSMDGVTFFPTDSANYAVPLTSSHGTPTVTNIASFSKTGAPWTSYLITATSSGTVSAQVRVKYVLRWTNTARAF